MPFKYDPSRHETTIGNNYDLKMLDSGNAEVPIILKSRHGIYLKTANPHYRDNTDNQFLQLDFIFNNQEDADDLYNILKKGTLKRVQRLTGRFKEEEIIKIEHNIPTYRTDNETHQVFKTLEDYPRGRIIFPDKGGSA